MSCAADMDGLFDEHWHSNGVELSRLLPLTTLLVWTWNSLYRIVVIDGSHVSVRGGLSFPDPTWARLDGAIAIEGRRMLMSGCIAVGRRMALRSADSFVMTAPVVAIQIVRGDDQIVH
jgi:hypothetical protein